MSEKKIRDELHLALQDYKKDAHSFKDYYKSMKDITIWLKKREEEK